MLRAHAAAAVLAAAFLIAAPAAAQAAAPANDSRATPQQLGALPAQVEGTTVDATRSDTDPFSSCAASGPNVWYRFTAPADGRVAVRLQADGDLDAALDGYLSARSQTSTLSCDLTDAKGAGAITLNVKKDAVYLVAVSALPNSVAGTFTLTVVAPQPNERPPGKQLAPGGADGVVDRTDNVRDAYSLRLREARTYRLRLSGRDADACNVRGALYPPGISDFSGSPVKRFGCDASGYATFTPGPGEGGRYSVLVSAAQNIRTLQRYHVESAGAGADDLAPGRFIGNRETLGGDLNGARIDALDLYRFTVGKRSDLELRLTAGDDAFDLLLLNEKGKRVECACGETGGGELKREIAPGRYFVAIRAADTSKGAYRLRRVSRVLTRSTVGFERKRSRLGETTNVNVKVRPGVSGPVTVTIQRFDPLSGWLFSSLQHARAVRGKATLAFRAPAVGRWRAKASFDGTVGAGSSATGFTNLLVVAPE